MTTDLDFPFDNETVYCENHPDRAAIEHCEVCEKALCGYCLYYTVDGQRLCKEHAMQAEAQGVQVISPAIYAAGIIPAQARATESAEKVEEEVRKIKGAIAGKKVMYQANNNDVMAFVALLVSVITVPSLCCMGGACLPLVGFLLSVLALVNAKDAVDTKRTRQQAFIGLGVSGVFGLGIAACIAFYAVAMAGAFQSNSSFNYYFPTSNPTYYYYLTPSVQPIATSTPRSTATPSPSATSRVQTNPTKAASPQPKLSNEEVEWWEALSQIFDRSAPVGFE
ncbi:MAG: B-box zinc finger protein [Anaerolineae bacterium]|nr:B-box zinc finger protein [Anaerolineae bacterium]